MRKTVLLASLLACAAASRAAVVLTIDTTNLSAVTFTATSAFAQNSNNSISTSDGITLLDFFTAPATSISGPVTGSLRANGVTLAFNRESLSTVIGTGLGLNLYRLNGIETENFSTSAAAFSGALTLDLSSNSGVLKLWGASGSVIGGDSSTANPVIGQYSVIPEPATTGLLIGLGGLLAVAARRFLRARKA